jgi:hypothetical protein
LEVKKSRVRVASFTALVPTTMSKVRFPLAKTGVEKVKLIKNSPVQVNAGIRTNGCCLVCGTDWRFGNKRRTEA